MRSALMFVVVTIVLAAILNYISFTYPQHRGYVHLFYGVAMIVAITLGIALYVKKRIKRG